MHKQDSSPQTGGSEEQPGLPTNFMHPRLDFNVTYSLAGTTSEGAVPAITVGSVYAMAREGAFTGDQYGPTMTPDSVKQYFAQSPQGAQLLIDNQRELAHKFGPLSIAFQDWVGVKEQKVAFWVSKKGALRACSTENIFCPAPNGSQQTTPIGGLWQAAGRQRQQLDSVVRRQIPRLPIFLLPSQFWFPHRRSSHPTTDVEATQQARERLRQLGLAEGTMSKVHMHTGSSLHSVDHKEAGSPQKGLPLALPLVHVLNYLQDRPPWCCFAPDPAQAKATKQCIERQGRKRQDESNTSISDSDSRLDVVGENAALPSGVMPVFKIPGLSLMLPTSAGHVDFAPLFLSYDQLHTTWSAIRSMHNRWIMRRRKSERREVRQLCELVAARLAGVGPQAQPPQQAAGSEDEEGMDEPPEVREFLQELGNDGGRGAAGADAAAGPLPTGPGGVLVSAAVGALSLGSRAVEWTCDAADTLYSKTPVGHKMLGLLSEPAVSVHALDRYVHAANAWNQKTLAAASQQSTTATSSSSSADTAEDNRNSLEGPGTGSEAASAGSGGRASMPDKAVHSGQVGGPEAVQSRDVASDSSGPSHEEDSSEVASQSGGNSGNIGEGTAAVEASSSMRSEFPPKAASAKLGSRVGLLLSKIRGRKGKAPTEQPSSHGEDQETSTPSVPSPPSSAMSAAGPTDPAQASMSSGAESQAPSNLEAPCAPGAASSKGSGNSSEASSRSEVALDWGQLNSSMMQSLHSVISDLIRAAVAKSLGMGLFGVEMRREEPEEGENGRFADGQDSGAAPSKPSWPGNMTKNDSPNELGQSAANTGFLAMTQNLTMMQFDTAKATGMVPDTEDAREGVLRGLLLIGDLNIDPSGRRLPWPIPPIGFGNAAHLANIADGSSEKQM
ncbi:g11708 [Coccomyxa elongata]